MTYDLTDEVNAIGALNFEGNIIPIEWLKHIRLPSNKPDLVSIFLLSEIVYWYRPTTIRDEFSGRIISYKKKFRADLLQKSYKDLEELFGLTKDQIKDSLQRLEKLNLIKRVFRNITYQGSSLTNVMFIQINPLEISKITEKKLDKGINPHTTEEKSPEVRGNTHTPKRLNPHTNTKNTTKITTNNSLSLKNSKKIEQNNLEREKEMLNIWDKIIREGDKPSVPSQSRLFALKKVLEDYFESNIENWRNYCLNIKKSNFLMGGGPNNWKADLTWVIRQENLIRVLEGYYHQKEGKTFENNKEELNEEAEEICDDAIWNKVKEILKTKRGESTYKSWFKKLNLKGYEDNKVLLFASTKFIKEWIISNYHGDIIDSFKQANFQIKELEIFVKDGEESLVL